MEDATDAGGFILLEHGEDEVFDGNVIVFEFAGFIEGAGEEAVEAGGDGNLIEGSTGTGDGGEFGQFGFEFGEGEVEREAGAFEQAGDEAVFLLEEGEEEVLDVDRGMTKAGGVVLGFQKGGLGAFGEFIEVHMKNSCSSDATIGEGV